MLLTLTLEAERATDLGYLLHKNPANPYRADHWFGTAHAFYPEVSETRCTIALLLEIDPIELVRGRGTLPRGVSPLLLEGGRAERPASCAVSSPRNRGAFLL